MNELEKVNELLELCKDSGVILHLLLITNHISVEDIRTLSHPILYAKEKLEKEKDIIEKKTIGEIQKKFK